MNFILSVFCLFFSITAWAAPAKKASASWRFAVSGDSRNCGDVVMPIIATKTKDAGADFYWHLGDFRLNTDVDEDIAHDPKYRDRKVTTEEYHALAWQDFIDNQLKPFSPVPVFLSIGNHEMIKHSRAEYLATFATWLDLPPIHEARVKDGTAASGPKTYYHWTEKGVDFITLDNASHDQFDAEQMAWFEKVLAADVANRKIKTIVVGMHEALPDSISFGHSMSESTGTVAVPSGRQVYHDLLNARDRHHKNIYVLASHSHFYMDGTFNTPYWRKNGGVLPGWIIGTAGAIRYPLPPESTRAKAAQTHVYGYLLATVNAKTGAIDFKFVSFERSDVAPEIVARYGSALVDECFEKNMSDRQAH